MDVDHSPTTLSKLPVDTWVTLADLLDPFDISALLATGHAGVRAILQLPEMVKRLDFSSSLWSVHPIKRWPSFLSSFPNLEHFGMIASTEAWKKQFRNGNTVPIHVLANVDLSMLGCSSLQTLHLDFPNVVDDVRVYLSKNGPQYFRNQFAGLRDFHLGSQRSKIEHIDPFLLLAALPSGLTRLTLRNIPIGTSQVELLPKGLLQVSLALYDSEEESYPSELESDARDILDKDSTAEDDDIAEDDEIAGDELEALKEDIISVTKESTDETREAAYTAWREHLASTSMMYVDGDDRGQKKSAMEEEDLEESDTQMNMDEVLAHFEVPWYEYSHSWPENLHTIMLDFVDQPSKADEERYDSYLYNFPIDSVLGLLPLSLTSLSFHIIPPGENAGECNWNASALPRSLKCLSVVVVDSISTSWLSNLPEDLEELRIALYGSIDDESTFFESLPKTLQVLELRKVGDMGGDISLRNLLEPLGKGCTNSKLPTALLEDTFYFDFAGIRVKKGDLLECIELYPRLNLGQL
jgi:hypothetical protein